jgi:methionine biosynthesis protein MetW
VVADPVRYLLLSFDTDWRFSTAHTLRIVAHLERAGLPVTFRELSSPVRTRFLPSRGSRLPRDTAGLRRPGTGGALMSRHDGLRLDLALVADQIFDGSRVLDLGCGEGVLLEHLMATRGCRGTGVEIDADAVLVAIRRGVPVIERDIDVALADIADDSYDTVVLSRTLQTMLRPEYVLQNMARVAERMVVSVPNFGYYPNRLRLLAGRMPISKEIPYALVQLPEPAVHHAGRPGGSVRRNWV